MIQINGNIFDQLRSELKRLREEEQPEFEEGQLTVRHLTEEAEYGEVVSDGLTTEEAQERTENSVQKRLLDRVEAMIDRVEEQHRSSMRRAFFPGFLSRPRINHDYLFVGKQSGKLHQKFREVSEHSEHMEKVFKNLGKYHFPSINGLAMDDRFREIDQNSSEEDK